MNILFLTLSRLYSIEDRGIYSDLMRKFVRDGHNVYIVVPFERRMNRHSELFKSSDAYILGVKTLNIQKTNIVEKGIGTLMLELQFKVAIKNMLKGIRFDLVLYSTPPITFNNVIASVKRQFGAKSYLLLKDIFPQNAVDLGMFSKHSMFYLFFRHKERKLYSLSDYIGCMSPANVTYILDHNPDIIANKVEICPNSLELDNIASSVDSSFIKCQYNIPTDKLLCIYGGNIGKPQGIDFLIKTINSNEKRTNCFFLVVGDGTEYSKIEIWFKQNNPHNAMLLRAISKDNYDKLMRCADIGLIFLDKRFTIPNYPSRLLSYLENRIPIIMAVDNNTDIGRIAEKNGYGLWSESGDLLKFDKNLDSILSNKLLRTSMGQLGYDFLLANYTVDKSTETILSHFN